MQAFYEILNLQSAAPSDAPLLSQLSHEGWLGSGAHLKKSFLVPGFCQTRHVRTLVLVSVYRRQREIQMESLLSKFILRDVNTITLKAVPVANYYRLLKTAEHEFTLNSGLFQIQASKYKNTNQQDLGTLLHKSH